MQQVAADANGKSSPGDTLRYTIAITNTPTTNLQNVLFNDSNSPDQTLVGGSIATDNYERTAFLPQG